MGEKKAKYETLSVDDLELDVHNPRIAQWVAMYTKIESAGWELALRKGGSDDSVSGPSYNSLKESIRTNGGVIHPIIVNRDKNGKMLVIEGNTRVFIYREFKKAKVEGKWNKIPALVYDNMSSVEIDAIRLQAHLVGVRDWDPYSKARYLNTLRNELNMPWSQVIDFGGGNQMDIEKAVAAYNDMETFYRPLVEADGTPFEYTRFSGFVELQNPRILQSLITNGFNKTDFSRWIKDKKIHPLETVRQLPRILQNEESKKSFLKDGAREAIKILDSINSTPSLSLEKASIDDLAKEIYKRVSSMPFSEILRLREEVNSGDIDIIRSAKDSLDELWKEINSKEE